MIRWHIELSFAMQNFNETELFQPMSLPVSQQGYLNVSTMVARNLIQIKPFVQHTGVLQSMSVSSLVRGLQSLSGTLALATKSVLVLLFYSI